MSHLFIFVVPSNKAFVMEFTSFLNDRVFIRVGDITPERVEAIVNAANLTLLRGGGVKKAVHRVSGEKNYQECLKVRQTTHPRELSAGQAVISTGGKLKARFIIDTVGPLYRHPSGQEESLLADGYRNLFESALSQKIMTVAFPSISPRAFGYPQDEAARISSQKIKDFPETDPN